MGAKKVDEDMGSAQIDGRKAGNLGAGEDGGGLLSNVVVAIKPHSQSVAQSSRFTDAPIPNPVTIRLPIFLSSESLKTLGVQKLS